MKIGNYVHLNYENYLRYGINYTPVKNKNSFTPPNISQILEDQRERVKNLAKTSFKHLSNKKGAKQIEDQLNLFYGGKNQTQKAIFNIDPDEVRTQAIQYIEEEAIDQGISAGLIDYSTLSSINKDNPNRGTGRGIGGKKIKDNDKDALTNYNAVYNKWQKILSLYNQYRGDETFKELELLTDNLTKEYEYFIKEVNKESKKYLGTNQKGKSYGIDSNERIRFNNFIEQLNELSTKYNNYVSVSKIHGFLGEYGTAAIANAVGNITNREKNKLIKGMLQSAKVVGDQTGGSFLDTNLFAIQGFATYIDKEGTKKTKFNKVDQEKFGTFTVKETQDKVDVILNLYGYEKPVMASVKNYNLSHEKPIHVLSGTSIIQLVQDYQFFINHYLNITQSITNSTKANKGKQTNNLILANRTLKLTMALHALAGHTRKTHTNGNNFSEQADIFILHDNSIGRFKVYHISEIINRIYNNPNYILLKNFSDEKNWKVEAPNLKEKNYQNAYKRISNLLTSLHSFNISLSIDKDVF